MDGILEALGTNTIEELPWWHQFSDKVNLFGYIIAQNQKNYEKEDVLALGKTIELL